MNVHLLTKTDTVKLTGGIWFCLCRCFFNHSKTTDLFVIVGSSFSPLKVGELEKKKHDAPQHDSEQNLLSCHWLWLVPSNYLLLLLWENKILLYESLVLAKSSSSSLSFLLIMPITAAERKYHPTSLSQWQTSNLIKTHLTVTHPHPCAHTHTRSEFEHSVRGQTAC